jgi:hypothetical protein
VRAAREQRILMVVLREGRVEKKLVGFHREVCMRCVCVQVNALSTSAGRLSVHRCCVCVCARVCVGVDVYNGECLAMHTCL